MICSKGVRGVISEGILQEEQAHDRTECSEQENDRKFLSTRAYTHKINKFINKTTPCIHN